jgi:hypothetical protein
MSIDKEVADDEIIVFFEKEKQIELYVGTVKIIDRLVKGQIFPFNHEEIKKYIKDINQEGIERYIHDATQNNLITCRDYGILPLFNPLGIIKPIVRTRDRYILADNSKETTKAIVENYNQGIYLLKE